jgi:hypothetical protein
MAARNALLHHAEVPAVYVNPLEAAKPKRGDGKEEQYRFVQVGPQRVGHRINRPERRHLVALASYLHRVREHLADMRRKVHHMPPPQAPSARPE